MRWNLLQELPMRTILPHPLPCVCWIACPGCECRALSDGVWNPKDTPVAVKPVGSGQALYTGTSWREDAAAVKKARRFGHPRQDVVGAGRWRMGKLRGWGGALQCWAAVYSRPTHNFYWLRSVGRTWGLTILGAQPVVNQDCTVAQTSSRSACQLSTE